MIKCTSRLFFLALLLFFSCERQREAAPAEHKVIIADFENVLSIDGYAEPIDPRNIVAPAGYDRKISRIVDDGAFVNEGDVVCVLEDQNTVEEYNRVKMQIENAEAEINKSKADLKMQYALMEAQVKNNEAETEIARLDSFQLKYSSENQRKIKELELQKSLIEKERLRKKLESLKVIQQSEVRKMELQIVQLKNRMDAARQKIEELTIKAPGSGIAIRGVNRWAGKKLTVGDPVWRNMVLVSIPKSTQMKIKINASEGNFKQINENDSVFYTFDAMPEGKGVGRILKKSPVGTPVKEGSNVKIFEIEASLDSCSPLPQPGFTCNCRIVLKKMPRVMAVPQVAVFEQDSMKVVYVVRDNGYEQRQVETGISSPKEIIITKGLKENERITLSKPRKELITGKTVFKKKGENKQAPKKK